MSAARWCACSLAVAVAAVMGLAALHENVAVVATSAAFFVFFSVLALSEDSNEHRKAARDRDDSDLAAIGAAAAPLALGAGIGTGERTPTPARLKETTAEVPILGFKHCHLYWSAGGRFALVSSYSVGQIALDADAKCAKRDTFRSHLSYGRTSLGDLDRPKPHTSPGEECSCGFYATKERQEGVGYGLVELDVELSGRVIVHEHGYRAQHQRVLRARVGGCHFCGEPVEAFAVNIAVEAEPEGIIRFGGNATSNVRPLCAAHITDTDVTVPASVIEARLGIPFDCATAEAAS